MGTVIKDQLREFESLEDSVPRSVFPEISSYKGTSAFVIKGLRRCGKSTLLKQIIRAKFENNFYYFNFDDERITGFKSEDFQTLMEIFIELFGERRNVFFDEIQNINGWELFINRILREGYTVFITGSNANLLSRELGTHLTGRHVDIELYPFSFTEFLRACKIKLPEKGLYSTQERALFSKKFREYFENGGMPELVVFSNTAVLTQVINDIIQKDIVSRHNIRKPVELKAVLKFLIANVANPITYRSIINNFGIKSINTIQKYIGCAEESYIIFTTHKYERKIKRFDKNPKKVYCIDNGIMMKNTPNINEKKGVLLENLIAIQLKRLGKEFYYYKGKTNAECDFVIVDDKQAMQACYELNESNISREIKGLTEAMGQIKAKQGIILTLYQEQQLTRSNKKIIVKPAWQWLIENEPRK
ncbi:MAG: ATP-binding protein [Candidatus Diapherotrites archaeon]|nr:ATP-binding protein [Candidatus Diapherotrites archaeon]